MGLSRDDVLYRLDILKRSLFLAADLPPSEALEILKRFVSASEHLGALTAADLSRSRLHDLSVDILTLLRKRRVLMRQLEEKLGTAASGNGVSSAAPAMSIIVRSRAP